MSGRLRFVLAALVAAATAAVVMATPTLVYAGIILNGLD